MYLRISESVYQHIILIKTFYSNTGVLTVDGVEYTGSSTGSFLGLDLADNMYLGSVPDYNVISPAAGFNTGFIGQYVIL